MESEVLTRPDRLAELEDQIYRGFAYFYEAGKALQEIQEEKLYKEAGFQTFDSYCLERWGIKRSRVYQLIDASKVYENLSTTVDKIDLPQTERQMRPLVQLEPEQQTIIWQQTVKEAGGQPTGQQVKQAASTFNPVPKPTGKMPPKIKPVTSTPNISRSDFDPGPGIEAEFNQANPLEEMRRKLEEAGYFVASEQEVMGDKCPCCGRAY